MSADSGQRVDLVALQRQAQAHYAAGRLGAALEAGRRMLAAAPDNPRLLAFVGLVAMRLGRSGEALAMFRAQRTVLERRGGEPNSYLQLGLSLGELGTREEAVTVLETGVKQWPQAAALYAALAEIHEKAGDFGAAIAAANKALEIDPAEGDAQATLAVALQRSGKANEAAAAYRRAIDLSPEAGFLHANLCAVLLELGDAAGVVETCDRWLAHDAGNVEALSFKAHALLDAGDEPAARYLLDFDNFLRTHEIVVPEGYRDLAAFNDALAAHVLAHPTLATPPVYHPTWHHPRLQITEELLSGDKGPVADLEKAMNAAVRSYLDALRADARHPFFASRPSRWRLSAWGAVLNGAGNQQAHIHKDGYLSGVYYVSIPDEISAEANGAASGFIGGFEVGRPPEELKFTAEPLIRAVKPREGLMLLFPAYMYHRTIPFTSDRKRICIAFDVVRTD